MAVIRVLGIINISGSASAALTVPDSSMLSGLVMAVADNQIVYSGVSPT